MNKHNTSFIDDIKELIDKSISTYKLSNDRFISDYNREIELTKEYNGRQLLELFQNADDAKCTEVSINLDTKSSLLSISNNGSDFSVEGIKSLMISNLSTKVNSHYIGNKGLGFRSILNWSEYINIHSNECKVSFSKEIAKYVFENDLSLSNEDKKKIRLERGLNENTVPFPVLAIPRLTNSSYFNKTTIEIKYQEEYLSDIEEQIESICPETLLFLDNISRISIIKNSEIIKELSRTKTEGENKEFDIIQIGTKSWKVFSKGGTLPEEYQDQGKNEKESYGLKIAFNDDLSDTYGKIFNFFPTQVSVHLPCVIHATIELNSSRNHINKSKKNEFILDKLVLLLKECSHYLTGIGVDWNPYKLICSTNNDSESDLIVELYKKLETLKMSEKIYPTIGGTYVGESDYYFYGNEFSDFFQTYYPTSLPELLLSLSEEWIRVKSRSYAKSNLLERVDSLSNCITSLELRADLIYQLEKVVSEQEGVKFSLLINDSNNVIPSSKTAFTPALASHETLDLPSFANLDIMKTELYGILIDKYKKKFSTEEYSRELQRILKKIVNIQPYDSNNVTKQIISQTKSKLLNRTDKETVIKEAIQVLFANFKITHNKQNKLSEEIPIVTKSRIINNAKELFISNTFPSGGITSSIYEGAYNDDNYIADIEYWELGTDNEFEVEEFFIWLGVNKFSKCNERKMDFYSSDNGYYDFVLSRTPQRPLHFSNNYISSNNYYVIDNFDDIMKLSVDQILLLVSKDIQIRNELLNNSTPINWSYRTIKQPIYSIYSFIRYQFIASKRFASLILEDSGDNINELLNSNYNINYGFLEKFGIDKNEVHTM